MKLPITQETIAEQIGRPMKSPVLVSNLSNLGIDQAAFLKYFKPLSAELTWDEYDPRRLRIELLKEFFPQDKDELDALFSLYFTGKISEKSLLHWIVKLNPEQHKKYKAIKPWRRRSISQFLLTNDKNTITVEREKVQQFEQNLDSTDFRSLPRVFAEAPKSHVENELFTSFLKAMFEQTQKITAKKLKKIRMVVHFMSVKSTQENPGDNSPEGAHEDGADFIVSALVINRINVTGAETQIIEQFEDKSRETILKYTLQEGEFVFQADTGEEKIYGNDLWHHVTPFYVDDMEKGESWRDIIGLDILIVE